MFRNKTENILNNINLNKNSMCNTKKLASLMPLFVILAEELNEVFNEDRNLRPTTTRVSCSRDFEVSPRPTRCTCGHYHKMPMPKTPPCPVSKNGLIEPVFKGRCGTLPQPKGMGCVMTDKEPDGVKIRVDRPIRENYASRWQFERDLEKYNNLINAADRCDWPLRNRCNEGKIWD